jgi:hypothetical protein
MLKIIIRYQNKVKVIQQIKSILLDHGDPDDLSCQELML